MEYSLSMWVIVLFVELEFVNSNPFDGFAAPVRLFGCGGGGGLLLDSGAEQFVVRMSLDEVIAWATATIGGVLATISAFEKLTLLCTGNKLLPPGNSKPGPLSELCRMVVALPQFPFFLLHDTFEFLLPLKPFSSSPKFSSSKSESSQFIDLA